MYGTHSMRRTKATLIYARTKNIRVVELLLGHVKLYNTIRYLGLSLKEVSSESMMYAMQLTGTYTQASRNDCFALALAKQEQCPLLTGDMALRKAAEKEAAIVKGTIWLVSQLVVHQQINTEQAREAYSQMEANGRRLPWTIAEKALVELER
jgi:hypothetical protein